MLYGTCIGLGDKAVIIQGPSGSGKSDLALRFINSVPNSGFVQTTAKPFLVADDQIEIQSITHHSLFLGPPATLAGLIEVRGLGIVHVPFRAPIALFAVVQCCLYTEIERFPSSQTTKIHAIDYPVFYLDPFTESAVSKLWLIFTRI